MQQSPLLFGLFLQASMILALGAQNIFVLEKGLAKDRPYLIAMICSACDAVLIMLGVLGAGSFFAENATLALVLKLAGSTFLFKYAYDKFKEARSISETRFAVSLEKSSVSKIFYSTLAVSLLNPHVYLDTVILIGGYSTKYAAFNERFQFALGASLFSAIWFFTLVSCASYFSTALRNPKAMRALNYGAAFIMTYLGINLLLSL